MLPGAPFGEIIFPMSRAFWDGDEEDVGEVPVDKRKVELTVAKPVAFSGAYDIVVVEGYLAADFVRAFLKEKDVKPVGNCTVEGPEETPHCKRCIVELFSPSDNLLICVCTNFFQVDLANDVFFKLHDHFGYEWNFLGLVSRSIVDYVSPTGSCDETFLLRQLSSKLASNLGGVKRLEAPNFITGLVAAGVQCAQVANRRGQLICVYSETPDLDRASFGVLKSCLESSSIGKNGPWPAKLSSFSSSVDRGNLYC